MALNLLQVKNKILIPEKSKLWRKKIILEEEPEEGEQEEEQEGESKEGEQEGEQEEQQEPEEKEKPKREKGRKTMRPIKGVAILGPEVRLEIDGRPIERFIPQKMPT